MKRLLKLGVFAVGLAAWYTLNGPSDEQLKQKKSYPLPDEISVIETNLPYEEVQRSEMILSSEGNLEKKVWSEKLVKTKDIDFSENLDITTEKYHLVKDKDFFLTRGIGHVMTLPTKLLFWDWDVGLGLDAEKTKAVLSMLENNKDLKNLTVRINHNEPLYDTYRLFSDNKVQERNNPIARATLGVLSTLSGELFAEMRRGDYYNPMTQTVTLYSNIESISAHELGHHLDFSRFTSDWEYTLASAAMPPVILYKEWQASTNARDELLPDYDNWQFNRYLLPAFFTYLLGGFYASRKLLRKSTYKKNGGRKNFDTLSENEKPDVNPLQTLRYFGTANANLYAGIEVYKSVVSSGLPEEAGYVGFVAGAIGTKFVTDQILKRVIPYPYQR